MSISNNLSNLKKELEPYKVTLVVVSKTMPIDFIMEAYNAGQRVFGENKVQECVAKHEALPKDIQWHIIGHLQTNKVKFIAPFISLIQSVDSLKLLQEINKEALKNNRIIDCLLQIHIAEEETKFGLSFDEAKEILGSLEKINLKNIRIIGLMGMSTHTDDPILPRKEFQSLKQFYQAMKVSFNFTILSMGMSGDYKIAIDEGTTLVRVGSAVFGEKIILGKKV